MAEFSIAKTIECKVLAGKFHNFIFETEIPILYEPGQYIGIKVADTRINCYSIATNEGGSKSSTFFSRNSTSNHKASEKVLDKFGLLVDTSPGGPGSKYFENLKPGDKISFLGPFGTFIFKPDSAVKHILFLGTGCGCAPLRCMIDNLLKVKHVQTPITLYLGLRYPTDIFWQDYFEKLSEDYPNFHFILTISRPDAAWQRKTGHITDLISRDFPNASGLAAYLCGNISMIEEVTNMLISRGLAREKIYAERF